MSIIRIHNVSILNGDKREDVQLYIADGKIQAILDAGDAILPADQIIDGGGHLLIPGMIDVHIHGAEGRDMMDGDPDSVQMVSRVCAKTGCTSFLATSVTSSLEDLLDMMESVRSVVGHEQGAHIVGIHSEGPYLNIKRKGMQNEKFLRNPNLDEIKRIIQAGGGLLKMVTLAPELPGSDEMIRFLNECNIIPAAAHSDATYEEAKHAFQVGVSHVTHCFNGMRPLHHRDPGLVLAAFEEEHVSVQTIVDYVHLHPAIVRLTYREKGAGKMVLITDALQAMGMGDGTYHFGGHEVTVQNGVARLDNGSLASSTVTMNEALRKTVESGIPLHDAVTMATRTPADILGLEHKGRIEIGADADFVLLNEQFEVLWTMVCGNQVYRRE